MANLTNNVQWNRPDKLDASVAEACLSKTMGEVFYLREYSLSARDAFVTSLLFDACFERDMVNVAQIAKRIDGTVPDEAMRGGCANMFGDAIEQVLDMSKDEQLEIKPDDLAIIALAKTVVYTSMITPKNPTDRKNKQLAIEMVFERTQGRKTSPTMLLSETVYTKPSWRRGLPDGNVDA